MNRFRLFLCIGLGIWFLVLFAFLIAVIGERGKGPSIVRIEEEKDISLIELEDFEELTKDEKDHVLQDKIRVLIKTSNYEKTTHENVVIVPDGDCDVYYGEASMFYEKGANITLSKEDCDAYAMPLYVVPREEADGFILPEVKRSVENPTYHGILCIYPLSDGYALVNEVYLEEYLCSVVPSEMPANYPSEALKAQAICARTYAYLQSRNYSYPQYEAHVDDSVSFQVYNNIAKSDSTTQAVLDTIGEVLFSPDGETLASVYYYSTSGGMGTDETIWMGNGEKVSYLVSKEIKDADGYFEIDEPYYAWTYEGRLPDKKDVAKKIAAIYGKNSNTVLTKKGDQFISTPITEESMIITDMEIVTRGSGGVAHELLITTKKKTYKILTEYYIRQFLCDGNSQVTLQNDERVDAATFLPSGFITLYTTKKNDKVESYQIEGGGYGHGVGMSQNAAKAMANRGYCMEEIMEFFFPGCKVSEW